MACTLLMTTIWCLLPYECQQCSCVEVSLWATFAVTLSWASDVTPKEGFTFVAIHSGTVNTDASTAMMQ